MTRQTQSGDVNTCRQLDHLRWLWVDSQSTNRKHSVKKADLTPNYKRAETLLAQFEEAKIFHTSRVTNAQADALAGPEASLSILDGVHHITVVERRLLTPLPETLPDPEYEEVCGAEMVTDSLKIGESRFWFSRTRQPPW